MKAKCGTWAWIQSLHPLRGSAAAGDLEWNYVKFLVGRDGVPRKRFNSLYNPKDFEGDVSAIPTTQNTLRLARSALRCLRHALQERQCCCGGALLQPASRSWP